MYKLILFDKDGTLLNFESVWLEVGMRFVDDFIDAFQIKEPRIELQRAIGIDGESIDPNGALASGTAIQYFKVLSQFTKDDSLFSWIKQQMTYYAKAYAHQFEMIDGTDVLFKQLKKDGYFIGIVTNDSTESTMQFINQFDLTAYVDVLITNDNQPYQKPDQRVIQRALSFAHRDEMIMIGDTPTDIAFGKAAQLGITIGVLSGTGRKEDLSSADFVVQSVDSLYDGAYIWEKGRRL